MDGISDEDQSTEYEFSDDEGQQALEIVDEEEPPVVQGRAKKRSATAMPDIHFQYVTSKFGKRMLEYDVGGMEVKLLIGSVSKNHEGCKMQFETNDLNQCVGKKRWGALACDRKVDIEIRRIMTQIPVLARQSGDAARKIFARVMEGSSVEAKARITQHNVSRLVYYHRNSLESNMPCSPETLIIPEELKNYENEPFVVFDSGLGAIRLIAFSTARLLRCLANATFWGLDGTFDLVPLGGSNC
uniref:Uncharacterized protein n=1 Tax=Ditylenchus dipsaci TaxID=166011 RepID=A0A915DM19_9BILA